MIFSLYKNFKAVTGIYKNTLYVTTFKIGSVSVESVMDEIHYLNEDSFAPYVHSIMKNTNMNRQIKLFIRDPFERYISGVIENVVKTTTLPSLITLDIMYHNDKKLSGAFKFMQKEYTNWLANGVPDEHLDLLINIFKVYFNKSAVYELYHHPHVQPFFTSINKQLHSHKIDFKPLYLRDFQWDLTDAQIGHRKHTNEVFKKAAIEAYNQVGSEIVIDMLDNETRAYNYLLSHREEVIKGII